MFIGIKTKKSKILKSKKLMYSNKCKSMLSLNVIGPPISVGLVVSIVSGRPSGFLTKEVLGTISG